jgi:multidrug resistance protein MdtO
LPVSASDLLSFLHRELAPTPGRGSATVRLTLACLAATIPVLTHRIPHALVIMIMMYLVTREDSAATLVGSILGVVGVTVGLGLALLAWQISLGTPWLRLAFFAGFVFGGLFLKRILAIGALGSAIGLPAALVMILPDILPPNAEVLVEFVLWIWWCVTLGLGVNAGVQLLLSPGDPVALLQRELDTRLHAVERALRRLAGHEVVTPAAASLASLAVAGMSRPLALLKTATLLRPWARQHREGLAALVTLTDRLVTVARALEALAPSPARAPDEERLVRAADGCQRIRRAFQERRRPEPGDWVRLAADPAGGADSPLDDLERTLDEIALAAPRPAGLPGPPAHAPEARPSLLLPDGFDNPEYVRFALKGTLAALICYVLFVGFDYPGIYTSVITCFVVSLSTIGASNQKGILRFGGAAAGGLMGLIALVYLLPNVDTIAGFWLVFGAGTAVAAWVNFGSPRIAYAGYQTGLAFYKAVLQSFGAALSATVVRDRLIGVFFGLVVFGIVEHLLWPVRAEDALRARQAELLRLLADLARAGTVPGTPAVTAADVDGWRRRISQKVEDVQGLTESSKFEGGALDLDAFQRRTGDAQIVFILLLALARDRHSPGLPRAMQARALEVDTAIAMTLQALSAHAAGGFEPAASDLEGRLAALERATADDTDDAAGGTITTSTAGPLTLYRSLVDAVKRLSPEPLAPARVT